MIVKYFAQKILLPDIQDEYYVFEEWVQDHKLSTVPVMSNSAFVGYIDFEEMERQFLEPQNAVSAILPTVVYENEHIYDAILKMKDQDCLVVLNEDNSYRGVLSVHQIPELFQFLNVDNQVGGMIALSLDNKDYSISEIGRISESSEAKVLALFVSKHENQSKIYVNIKYNIVDLSQVVSAFERFGYEVSYVHQQNLSYSETQENYQSLMKFLEL